MYIHSCMYSATELMIKNITFYAYSKCIRLKWSPPSFPPYFYFQTITCNLLFHRRHYLQSTFTLERDATSSRIGFLEPESECQIKLRAVYNPATLDPGIYMSVFILSDCELNQCKLQEMYSYICIGSLWLPVKPKLTSNLVFLLMYKCNFLHNCELVEVWNFSQVDSNNSRSWSGCSFLWLAQITHPCDTISTDVNKLRIESYIS